MSELRQDPITGRWVILAPERALRPNSSRSLPEFDPHADDPFAEGREWETPGELQALRLPDTLPDTPGWRVRVVPNKYPAVRLGTPPANADDRFCRTAAASGPHEVIVECPHFESCLSRLPLDQVGDVVWMYRERLRFHRREQTCAHALVFKNKGVAGGATLAHVHAQLIGTPWIPVTIEEELASTRRYFAETNRLLFADLVERELSHGRRVAAISERFVVLCPFASRVPCEVWIVPRQDQGRFEDINDSELREVAELLRNTLLRMHAAMPGFPYNYSIHSLPFSAPEVHGFRWHIEILPRIGSTAGFEWGGGCYINTVPPEDAAQTLRSVAAV